MSDDTVHQHQQQTASWSELVQTGGSGGLLGSTVALTDSGKSMEESTTATAPTMITGVGDAHTEIDDDTTTIRSFDSLPGRLLQGDLDDSTFDQHHAPEPPPPPSLLGPLTTTETCSVSTAPTDEASSFCLLYTSPSPRDLSTSRMPSSA